MQNQYNTNNNHHKLAWVDKNKCIGCGVCVDLCDDVFQITPCGIAETLITSVENSNVGKAEEAKDKCPTCAIEVS